MLEHLLEANLCGYRGKDELASLEQVVRKR
jgi:hypothetical protein